MAKAFKESKRVDFDYLQLDNDFSSPKYNFKHLYEIESDGAVLVRPDGHVAWRSISAPGDTFKFDLLMKAMSCYMEK